ncbi:MAG TPA: DUF6273 domain-containing protein [Mobilitalea sp.]|nr:DUF6273 domain-containing protein [Mobilitalea sp.]
MPNKNNDPFLEVAKAPEIEENTANNTASANQEVIDNEKELKYQKAVVLMKSIKCMTACSEKTRMYKQVSKDFTDLTGYKDSVENAEACIQLAKQSKKEIKQSIYKRAQYMKNSAKLAAEFKAAAEEFRKVSGYKDSDDMASECDRLESQFVEKDKSKKTIQYGIVALVIIAIVVCFTSKTVKYYTANAYMGIGAYNSAASIYQKLGSYKDSKNRLEENEYQNALALKKKGDFVDAASAFEAAKNYKDSENQKVAAEKLLIQSSKVGDTVKLGNCDWEILDIANNQAFLMKKAGVSDIAYNNTAGNVTWEQSSLRKWLNSDFLNTTFSAAERNNIVVTQVVGSNNTVYGTSGGNTTQDYLYLMGIDEVSKYGNLFAAFKTNSWLRNPGNSQSSAAFISVKGTIMPYGYDVSSTDFSARPVMWFKLG